MSVQDPIYIGQRRKLKAEFFDDNDAPADPTTVKLSIRRPSGDLTELADGDLDHPDTGVFEYLITLDEGGNWEWRYEGTGNVETSGQESFYVESSNVN
jgi:hypothetical protein